MTVDEIKAFDIVQPSARAMIESLRAIGYSPATAIADIIDNSISAKAKNIWLTFYWSGSNSYISILDDGTGMDEDTLIEAMRPGSKNPLEERSSNDLGRFGMGLKTASFSQCKRLTVRTKIVNGSIATRSWDIDHVIKTNQWQLLKTPNKNSEERLLGLNTLMSGTMVLWENLDRLLGFDSVVISDHNQSAFYAIVTKIRIYLEMVFHDYLEGINPLLKIYFNGNNIENLIQPWDPFYETHPATTIYPPEEVHHKHGVTVIKGYVLPHKDKMTTEELRRISGPDGWNARQGFYIYRNRRLLVAGGWLGLGIGKTWNQEEQYKLARIRIDITNSLDFDWLIDIKKSTAKPPYWIKDRLTTLGEKIRKEARDVFVFRGKYGPRKPSYEIKRIWNTTNHNATIHYKIDRKHFLIQAIEQILSTKPNLALFYALLRTLEETVPVAQIWLDTAENADQQARPFENSNDLEKKRLVSLSYSILRNSGGFNHQSACQILRECEEYQDCLSYIDEISKEGN
jgi:hypothetical protein